LYVRTVEEGCRTNRGKIARQEAENAAQKQALAAKDETIAHGLLAVVERLSDPSNTYTPCTTSLLRLVAPWLVVLASHLPTVIIR
jgi:hypothetical protein